MGYKCGREFSLIGLSLALGCGSFKHQVAGSTPSFSTRSMAKANPIDSDGRKAAVRLSAKKHSKASAKDKNTSDTDPSGPLIGAASGIPEGLEIDHSYFNFAAFAFYPDLAVGNDELGVMADLQKFVDLDVKIESAEGSNPHSTPDVLARKISADITIENQLIKAANPYAINDTPKLLDINSGDQSLGDVSMIDGTYKRFDGLLGRADTGTLDNPLAGFSLALVGWMTVSGKQVPFAIKSHKLMTFRADLTGAPLVVSNGATSSPFGLNLDPSVWFNGIDLTSAQPTPDGQIVIDDTHNNDLLKAIKLNLISSLVTNDTAGAADGATTAAATAAEDGNPAPAP